MLGDVEAQHATQSSVRLEFRGFLVSDEEARMEIQSFVRFEFSGFLLGEEAGGRWRTLVCNKSGNMYSL
jgi:hypothetical protein